MIRAFFFERKRNLFHALTQLLHHHYKSTRFPMIPDNYYEKEMGILGHKAFKRHLQYTLAISGGESINELFQFWHECKHDDIAWQFIDYYWLNECNVPYTDERSCYGNAHRNFFQFTTISPHKIHPIKVKLLPEKEAHRYASQLPLSSGVQYNPAYHYIDSSKTLQGFCSPFHCAILELDKDGFLPHVPIDTPAIFTNTQYYAIKNYKTNDTYVTASLDLLRNIPRLIVILSGRQNSRIVEDIYYKRNSNHPMINLLLHHPNVHIMVDNKHMETTIYPERMHIGHYFPGDALDIRKDLLSDLITF